ncbi:MAG: PHB depolymerase family esterase [Pseudomonadota bacterium]
MRVWPAFVPALILTLAPVAPAAADTCGKAEETLCQVADGAYRIAMPEGEGTVGAMVWLHGWGGSANGVMKNTGMIKGVTDAGLALIAPDGRITSTRFKNKNWSVNDGRDYERNDLDFLTQVVADAVDRHGIDPDRVLLAGFSRGGSMVWDVACRRPDLARAYAPVAGAFWEPMFQGCDAPVDLFHTHGWTDRTVPLEGRPLAEGTMTQGDVFQSLYILRATNGCANRQPETGAIDEQSERWFRAWTDCTSGRQILLMLHPGGHGIPKGWLNRTLAWFNGLPDGS